MKPWVLYYKVLAVRTTRLFSVSPVVFVPKDLDHFGIAHSAEKSRCGQKRQNDSGELRRYGVRIAQDSRNCVGLDCVEGQT